MNEHELFMMRMEIGELNKAIDRILRASDKQMKSLEMTIFDLMEAMKDTNRQMSKLANAIYTAAEVKLTINEDDWYDDV